jgi:hypothetical protein
MDIFPEYLTSAAGSARDGLVRLAGETAAAGGIGAGGETRRMAAAARTAIFADALLGAVRARLEELRSALK